MAGGEPLALWRRITYRLLYGVTLVCAGFVVYWGYVIFGTGRGNKYGPAGGPFLLWVLMVLVVLPIGAISGMIGFMVKHQRFQPPDHDEYARLHPPESN